MVWVWFPILLFVGSSAFESTTSTMVVAICVVFRLAPEKACTIFNKFHSRWASNPVSRVVPVQSLGLCAIDAFSQCILVVTWSCFDWAFREVMVFGAQKAHQDARAVLLTMAKGTARRALSGAFGAFLVCLPLDTIVIDGVNSREDVSVNLISSEVDNVKMAAPPRCG